MFNDRKDSISFRTSVLTGATGTLKRLIDRDGTIEKVRVRFYQGQVFGLQIRPYVLKAATKHPLELVKWAESTDTYLSGDDDVFELDQNIPVTSDDEICIDYNNTAAFMCHICVDVSVDYYGGQRRVI